MSDQRRTHPDFARFSLDIERGDEGESSAPPPVSRIRPGSRATSSRASSSRSMRYPSIGYNGVAQHQSLTEGGIQIIQDSFDDEEVGFCSLILFAEYFGHVVSCLCWVTS